MVQQSFSGVVEYHDSVLIINDFPFHQYCTWSALGHYLKEGVCSSFASLTSCSHDGLVDAAVIWESEVK